MRNSLLHLLFLAAPLLAAELGGDLLSRVSRLTVPTTATACDSTACEAPAATRKPAPAPTAPATPPPPASHSTVRTPRRPLPAHLFM